MAFALFLLISAVCADVYLHSPAGSNDRNREKNQNRQNGDLIFDSQNNDKGGYPWHGDREANNAASNYPTFDGAVAGPQSGNQAQRDKANNPMGIMQYYEDSNLRIEWTAQHACGPNANLHCDLVLQVGCDNGCSATNPNGCEPAAGAATEQPATAGNRWYNVLRGLPGLRDGYPTGALTDYPNNNNNNNIDYQYRSFNANGQNNDGTNRQNANGNDKEKVEFVQHESWYWYEACQELERNKGLYIADQNVNNNQGASATRQNPNANQRGFECQEERDYYPWLAKPSPWNDVSILTSNTSWCAEFQSKSQNVYDVEFCDCGTPQQGGQNGQTPRSEQECVNTNSNGDGNCQWVKASEVGLKKNLPPPECKLAPFSRDNHLGNAEDATGTSFKNFERMNEVPAAAHLEVKIPKAVNSAGQPAELKCVYRLRYNISGADAPLPNSLNAADGPMFDDTYNIDDDDNELDNTGVDMAINAYASTNSLASKSKGKLATPYGVSALYNRPYVFVDDTSGFQAATRTQNNNNNGVLAGDTNTNANDKRVKLGLAINTNQNSRTFQDRTFAFKVLPRPADLQGQNIYNLNSRGCRGNIVQCYPSVEYDFSPKELSVCQDDFVHFQFTGSDFNVNRNPNNADGWRYSTRTNLVETQDRQGQQPRALVDSMAQGTTLFPDLATARTFAFAAQNDKAAAAGTDATAKCDARYSNNNPNGNTEQNARDNCGKLNAADSYFNMKPMKAPSKDGTYNFGNTRNNNFSNRSQKSGISVRSGAGCPTASGAKTSTSPWKSDEGGALSGGATAGVVIGVVIGAVLIGGGIVYFVRNRKSAPPPPPPPGGPGAVGQYGGGYGGGI